jgi:hypothetical protein
MSTEVSVGRLRSARWGAAAGVFFAVATIVGNELANQGDAAGDGAATALANVRRHHGLLNHLGIALEILGFVALMFFAGYLYRILRRGEGQTGWLAATALIAAAADLGVKLGSGASLAAAYYHPADLTPEMARMLLDLNDAAFVITGITMAAFVLAVSASACASRVLPRTLVWIGVALGVLGLASPIVSLLDPSDYNPLPYLVALLWVAAIGIARVVIDTRTGRAAVAPTAPMAGGSSERSSAECADRAVSRAGTVRRL